MYKIAYCIRNNYYTGGDGVQVLKTKEFIEKQFSDISITIVTSPKELDISYDLVHIFNYATWEITESFFLEAEKLGIKIVSSPIFWDYSYSKTPIPLKIMYYKDFIGEKYVLFHRFINKFLCRLPIKKVKQFYHEVSPHFAEKIKQFIESSIYIMPNSIEEGIKCCEFARCKDIVYNDKMRVVLNGTDIQDVCVMEENDFFEKYKIPRDFVLQVSRIEYLKNQLNLISAMEDNPEIPIVFLGSYKGREDYYHKVLKQAKKRGNVYFVEKVPHDDVYSFFRYARTHVLLSLRESPGLSSLEALSQGCPIVVSDERFAPVKTYFKENCEIVNPLNKEEIKFAILKSYKKSHKKIHLDDMSWTNVAKTTYNIYKEVLK